MRGMLLAAGLGERMRPLTTSVPKPAVPVLGRPIGFQALRLLARAGVGRLTVNLHHLGERVREALGNADDVGCESLDWTVEPEILGTGGGIRNAADHLRGEGTFVVRNADFLADVDLGEALDAHRRSGRPATLVLTPIRPPYTPIEIDRERRITRIGARSVPGSTGSGAEFLFTGLHLLEEEILDRIPARDRSEIVRDVYLDLMEEGRLGAWVHEGFWHEFGSPEGYLEGSLSLLALDEATRGRAADADPVRILGAARVAVGAGADFHAGVDLRGGVALGFATRVAEGTVLQDTIVMPEAWIGPGVRLCRSIVGPGAEVPAGFEGEGLFLVAGEREGEALRSRKLSGRSAR